MTAELFNTLLKYAKQDLRIAKKQNVVGITQTKKGNIEIDFDGKTFQARNFNNTNIKFTERISFEDMANWLANIYEVA